VNVVDTAGPAARQPQATGSTGSAWVGSALVALALAGLVAWVIVFVRTPLTALPLYFGAGYFVLDATSMLFLLVINAVFLGISVYMSSRVSTSPGAGPAHQAARGAHAGLHGGMNLGVMANHLLLLWAFIELTTLCAGAPGGAGRQRAPRRVAWHYLLYSSMSLALTFLGFMCLTRSAALQGQDLIDFAIDQHGGHLARPGRQLAAPGPGADPVRPGQQARPGAAVQLAARDLRGRAHQHQRAAGGGAVQHQRRGGVPHAAGVPRPGHRLRLARAADHGLPVAHVAAVQVMAARNYKRLIAYACVSSSGVIAIGLSVGKAAAYGVVLYIVSNAFVKALLFLTAGRCAPCMAPTRWRRSAASSACCRSRALLFAVGTFALLGFPPFGSFMAEMLILSGIVQAGNLIAFTLMCTMLTIIFVATGRSIFPMLWGPSERQGPPCATPGSRAAQAGLRHGAGAAGRVHAGADQRAAAGRWRNPSGAGDGAAKPS
jgi:hydrogenase-4 component F